MEIIGLVLLIAASIICIVGVGKAQKLVNDAEKERVKYAKISEDIRLSQMAPSEREAYLLAKTNVEIALLKAQINSTSNSQKSASVVKCGVAGGIIAGPTGAIIGALSAVDKNNRNAQNKK